MKTTHREHDIREECEKIVKERGTAALTRGAVQEALRRRAEQANLPVVGVDNGTVGRIIREVLTERRQARTEAREADVAQAASGELPQRVAELIARLGDEMRTVISSIVTEIQRRSDADAQARVTAAADSATARIAELEGELASRSEETEALAADQERAAADLEALQRDRAAAEAALSECRTVAATRQAALQQRVEGLEAELRTAEGSRRDAQARAHAAELGQSRLEAVVARLEERLSAAERMRDEWQRTAERQEGRAREAERVAEERRVRLDVTEAKRALGTPPEVSAGMDAPTEGRVRPGPSAASGGKKRTPQRAS
jgi:chromosome segregation ATPase